MATLLVIGGSGFFGKSILDMFQRGELARWNVDKVIAMSRSAKRLETEVPELVIGNVELVELDIATTSYLPEADYVIHAAASTDARNYLNAGDKERENIQAGTLNYCNLAKSSHKSSKILYVSSGAVYGTQPAEMDYIDETYQFNDPMDIPEGKRDYTVAKRDAEALIKELGADEMNVSIARCFAFVGKYLPRDQHFAIGNFIADGLEGRPIKVKANHLVYRSYMYADDLVAWMMEIVVNANSQCPLFNVGADQSVSMGCLASKVAAYFEVAVDAENIVSEKIDRYVPSIQKAFDELGLGCKFDLDQSIHQTIQAIKHNDNYMRIIK
jgi:nucleoside-diphosphate-sugar epimerase